MFDCQQISRTIAVGLIICADQKILLGKKRDGGVYPDCWHLPGGGIRQSETPVQALIREIKEETSLDLEKIQAKVEMIDNKGRGEHLKKMKDGQIVSAKMKFVTFKVSLLEAASKIKVNPGDDLIELNWIELGHLKEYKHTPPSKELFLRLKMT